MSEMDEKTSLPAPASQPSYIALHRRLMPDRVAENIRLGCLSGSEMEHGKLMMLNPPTKEQREVLSSRHRAIVSNLNEHNTRDIAAAVSDVMACYRNFVKADEDPAKVVAKYVKELHGIPTWACIRACHAIRDNQTTVSKEFPFSTMTLRAVAEGYIKRLQDEAQQISEIMRGGQLSPLPSPETRAKVKRSMERLAFKLKSDAANLQRDALRPVFEAMGESSQRLLMREWDRVGQKPRYASKDIPISPQLFQQSKERQRHGNATGADTQEPTSPKLEGRETKD